MRNLESNRAPRTDQRAKVSKRPSASPKRDFWDKVADDVASGWGARGGHASVRNRDQHPGP